MAISLASLVYVVFLAAMITFNIAGNSLVCFLILKKKALKTSVNWLLFYLAIADLLVAVFFIPPCILSHFVEQPSGFVGDLLCKFIFSGVLGWVAAAASSYLLVVIAFERYHATVRPLEQLSRVLPICIMGYLYIQIILCLRNRVYIVPGSSSNSVSQSRIRVTKMLLSVSVIFIACWTPPAVLCVMSPVIPGGYVTVYYVTKASALLNSCVNPLVYTLYSEQFRKSLASLVCCLKPK
ncbi:hypothetical protein ACROYT_G030191 [Oculina patagonica]